MYDFCRFWLPIQFANTIRQRIRTSLKVDSDTGEIIPNSEVGLLENLEIEIKGNWIMVSGSMHKFYNIIMFQGNQNYNDFTFPDFVETLEILSESLGVDVGLGRLTVLEVGFNVEIEISPTELLEHQMMFYEWQPPNGWKQYGGKGFYYEFETSQFYFKLYDKGRQYDLDKHLIRAEYKYKSNILKRFGVRHVRDLLDPDVIHTLRKDLVNRFRNDVVLLDDPDPKWIPDESDRTFIKEGSNPKYWTRIGKEKSAKTVSRRKMAFLNLIQEYGLDTMKDRILHTIRTKAASFYRSSKMSEISN